MKIKAFHDKNLDIIKIPCVLKTPHKRIVSDFIFDTGSANTILNFTDSLRLNIPRINKSELVRMGGRKYQSYEFNKLEIVFKSTENEAIIIKMPIKSLKPTTPKIGALEELDDFPNLLGLDFLKQGYKFFCDLDNEKIYFEK